MLKQLGKWTSNSIPLFPHPNLFSYTQTAPSYSSPFSNNPLKIRIKRANETLHRARRRIIYDDDNEDEDYGYNEELAMLESYTQLVKDEILLVQAMVDDEQVEVLIYKVGVHYIILTILTVLYNFIYIYVKIKLNLKSYYLWVGD